MYFLSRPDGFEISPSGWTDEAVANFDKVVNTLYRDAMFWRLAGGPMVTKIRFVPQKHRVGCEGPRASGPIVERLERQFVLHADDPYGHRLRDIIEDTQRLTRRQIEPAMSTRDSRCKPVCRVAAASIPAA